MEKLWHLLVCCCIAIFVTCVPALAQEPSQGDMQDAINKNFAPLREDIKDYITECADLRESKPEEIRKRIRRQDRMFFRIQCQFVSGVEDISIKETKKIACEKAVGKPGYVCDYFLDFIIKDASPTTPNEGQNSQKNDYSLSIRTVKDALNYKYSGPQTSRFVYDGKDWIMIEQFDLRANSGNSR